MALTRSQNMSRIHSADTTPEVALRAALEARGLSSDTTLKTPAGKADLVFAEASAPLDKNAN